MLVGMRQLSLKRTTKLKTIKQMAQISQMLSPRLVTWQNEPGKNLGKNQLTMNKRLHPKETLDGQGQRGEETLHRK